MQFSLFLFVLLLPMALFAGGFEKATQWSAHEASIGGAASSSVKGANSLYFNPAGLASGESNEISLNIVPTFAHFDAPIQNNDQNVESKSTLKTPFAALGNYRVNDQFGIGIGVYSAGGTAANYENVPFEGFSMRPRIQSSLALVEASIGAGYKITQNLSVGAAWRASLIDADLSSTTLTPLGGKDYMLSAVNLKDIRGQQFTGFRLGAQYVTDDRSAGLGLTWRTPVKFKAETTKVNGKVEVTGTNSLRDIKGDGRKVTIENTFPNQISLDAHKNIVPELTLYAGYTWTQYSVNKQIKVDGGVVDGISQQRTAIPNIEQNWNDQHNFRVGLEDRHLGDYKIRGGYVYTTPVTDKNSARATFSSPGPAHSFLAGLGHDFLQGKLTADIAGEYSMAKGNGRSAGEKDTPKVSGNYKSSAWAAYTSVLYRF